MQRIFPGVCLYLLLAGGPLQAFGGEPGGLAAPVASYTLVARLDPESHRITGQGEIRWVNRTENSVHELRFHLYLNAFRHSATSFLSRGDAEHISTLAHRGWGAIDLTTLATAEGENLLPHLEPIAPDDGNRLDATVAQVALSRAVLPGETLRLTVAFVSQLPFVVERTGFKNNFHFVAQWFPKLGVLEADGTWTCPQFHPNSEFFADFGDYDVTLEVPSHFVVGATGARLSSRELGNGLVAHRYLQPSVHDFAWTAWPGFTEHRQRFAEEGLPEVEMILLLRPETSRFAPRYFAALRHGLSRFGNWYSPYPYSTLTLVDPPWGAEAAGGMEYPTFIATGARVLSPTSTWDPENVTVHELGHQFWYGLVASDEFRESYLDEGLTTYSTARVMRAAYPPRAWSHRVWGLPVIFESITLDSPLDTSARFFRRANLDPITRTAWGYSDAGSYRALTYSKMALLLEQLERTLGAAKMDAAMRAYAERFRFRHPRTRDFVATLSEASGVDLRQFFDQLLFGSGNLDFAVAEVSSGRRKGPVGQLGQGPETKPVEKGEVLDGYESTVLVRRLGEVRLPVEVELRFADGRVERRTWNGEERWRRYRILGPQLISAEVDPDEIQQLDVNRLNNSLSTKPDRRASRRWHQRMRFWVQNLLETAAAFA